MLASGVLASWRGAMQEGRGVEHTQKTVPVGSKMRSDLSDALSMKASQGARMIRAGKAL